MLALLGMLFIVNDSQAQQDAEYTQYMFNSLVLNPAYAGSRGVVSTNALYRNQWVNIDGAPTTLSFSIHSPIRESNSALGLWLENDQIGLHRTFRLMGSYAYHLPLNKGKLSFGLQAGVKNYRYDFTDHGGLLNDDQFAAINAAGAQLLPNIGAGLYYYTQRFYLGLSAPELLENTIYEDTSVGLSTKDINHYFLTAGYVLPLGNNLKFKPTTLVKFVRNAPVEIDLTAHFLLREVLWLGAAWRSNDSIDFLAEYQFTPQLRAGYAYDLTISELRNHTSGTHEIMLGYDFCFNKNRIVTPRYF